jgi:YggT family protein
MQAALSFLISAILDLILWVVIIQAVLSWLFTLNIINPHNHTARQIYDGLNKLTEPLFAPLRRFLPSLGGLDLTPVVVLLGLQFIRILLSQYGII